MSFFFSISSLNQNKLNSLESNKSKIHLLIWITLAVITHIRWKQQQQYYNSNSEEILNVVLLNMEFSRNKNEFKDFLNKIEFYGNVHYSCGT